MQLFAGGDNRLLGLGAVIGVYFEANAIQAQIDAGDGGVADAHKGVEDQLGPLDAVELQAHLGDFDREGRRVWALFVAIFDGLVGYEPGVAAAAAVGAVGAAPPAYITFVLIFDADREAV